MSFQALHAAWLTTVGDASAQLVMFALAGHHNDETGQCNPSQATLARRTGLSVDTVGRACKRLVDDKLISRHVNRNPQTGFRYSDSYTLHFASPRQLALLLVKQADEEDARGQPGNLQGLQLAQAGTAPPNPHGAGTGQHGFASAHSPHGADETSNKTRKKGSGTKMPDATVDQVQAIWDAIPSQRARPDQPRLPDIRKRSESKGEVGKALSTRLREGHSFDQVLAGVVAYYADPDVAKDGPDGPYHWAKGAQRVIRNGLWETYLPDVTDDNYDDDLFGDPRPGRQTALSSAPVALVADWQGERWLEEWLENPASWRSERGPTPGTPGCRINPDLLHAAGVTAGPVGGASA